MKSYRLYEDKPISKEAMKLVEKRLKEGNNFLLIDVYRREMMKQKYNIK